MFVADLVRTMIVNPIVIVRNGSGTVYQGVNTQIPISLFDEWIVQIQAMGTFIYIYIN